MPGCASPVRALALVGLLVGCRPGGDPAPAATPGPADAAGLRLYRTNCSPCHGIDGLGTPSVAPPLAGRAAALSRSLAGRAYLVAVPLFGLEGPIAVEGRRYSGMMPGFGFRSDTELAAILNHVLTAWGGAALLGPDHHPVSAEEVRAIRTRPLPPDAVRGLRATLFGPDPVDPPGGQR